MKQNDKIQQSAKQINKQCKQMVFPYVYGSLAFTVGKKGQSFSHKWICYVRGTHNQDLSYLIDKVIFKLHDSFENPTRQKSRIPPFQIQQLGWGQFQIRIQIYFKHPNMPQIEVSHMLKLPGNHSTGSQTSKKPLCSEVYDEIVFVDPDECMEEIMRKKTKIIQQLMQNEKSQNDQIDIVHADQPLKSIVFYEKYMNNFDPDQHKGKLEDALRFITHQIRNLQDRMKFVDNDTQNLFDEIYKKSKPE